MSGAHSICLASGSPRRSALLARLGVDFFVAPADIDERRKRGESAHDYVTRLAREKAWAVWQDLPAARRDDTPVLGADTIVTLGGRIFGKPNDRQQAFDMWRALSNTRHEVYTAIAVYYCGQWHEALSRTEVTFGPVIREQMEAYWASGEPRDKAGGYAIQGGAKAWVKEANGSVTGVIGLPLEQLRDLLVSIGIKIPGPSAE